MAHGSAFMLSVCAALVHSVFAQTSICSTQMFSNPGNVITYGERFGVVSGCQLYVLAATFHVETSIGLTEFKTLHQANFELAMIAYFSQSLASPPTIHDWSIRVQLTSVAVSTPTLIIDFMLHSPNRIHGTINAQQVNTYLANVSVPAGTFVAIDDSIELQEVAVVFGTTAIISASVGGFCLIAIIVGIIWCCCMCNRKKGGGGRGKGTNHGKDETEPLKKGKKKVAVENEADKKEADDELSDG